MQALSYDIDGDLFEFEVGSGKPLAEDAHGRPAWRFAVNAILPGKSFVKFHLDLVERPGELVGLTTLTLPIGAAAPSGATARTVIATNMRQQFAEIHALTRSYASGESSRVKDLLDIILLAEDGLVGDAELHAVATTVFAVRGTSELPAFLGPPPVAWAEPFRKRVESVGLSPMNVEDAGSVASTIWLDACRAAKQKDN